WWGSVFLINVPIVVIALIATTLLAPPNMPNPTKHWDLISSIFALITLTGLTLAIKELANPNRSWILVAAAFIACVIGGFLFTRRQNRLEEPLLTFDIFRNRLFLGGVIAASRAMFIMAGLEMITVQKLQLAADFSPFLVGVTAASVAMFIMCGLEMITAQKLQLADDFSPFHVGDIVAAAAIAALPMSA